LKNFTFNTRVLLSLSASPTCLHALLTDCRWEKDGELAAKVPICILNLICSTTDTREKRQEGGLPGLVAHKSQQIRKTKQEEMKMRGGTVGKEEERAGM
jgi:hypothetical protein